MFDLPKVPRVEHLAIAGASLRGDILISLTVICASHLISGIIYIMLHKSSTVCMLSFSAGKIQL